MGLPLAQFLDLGEETYNAEKQVWVGGNLVLVQESSGSPQTTALSLTQGYTVPAAGVER